jgi:peptide/nickel transport system substrate-binding protein
MPVSRPMPRRAPLALVACVLLGTACTGTAERHPGEEGQPRPGGTLYVLVEGEDFPHIDPQRTHYTPATNVVRLFARTLTTYRPAAGRQGSELVPDLATDLGRPTNRNTEPQVGGRVRGDLPRRQARRRAEFLRPG